MKIKDRIMLGIVTGLIASIPGRILNYIEYSKGLTEHTYEKTASSFFLKDDQLNSLPGKIIGSVANQVVSITAGVGTAYVLSITGRDHAVTKGIGIQMMYWMLLVGLPSNLGISTPPQKPITPLLALIDHIVFGASCGFIVSKLGDHSLFPEANDQLPLLPGNSN